ncbi:MAG: hypothetical protein AAF512_13065 [Pseudomonadota bacterium]
MIAHVLEAQGLTTLTIGTVRPHIEKVKPPRGLVCEFPLGRPLGKPNDVDFQHAVLSALFGLLDADGPVLQDYPETVSDTDAETLVCALPPRMDADIHPAVDEAQAIKNAYDRAIEKYGNRIGANREISAEQVPEAISKFVELEQGANWKEVEMPGNMMRVAQDIRGYYQTAALELAEHSPGAWAGEDWYYNQTEAGRLMLRTRTALKDGGAPQPVWFYLSPGDRPV